MDRKFSKNPEIQRLILLAESARACLGNEATFLKKQLDLPARLRGSLRGNPIGWLLGSLGSVLAASLMFRRKSLAGEKKKRNLPQTLLGLFLTTILPFAKNWLMGQVKSYLMRPRSGR